ncbi:hypothetical protein DC522_13815 [Microvirga sp. KLBC 81]|uniref:M10 family metallopeptidase C-terminal domain-containing protein n=1 Tax=Microvirga sp. KLBC 81 TaxID=1862707 RepID=UPI000D51A711|nr:M10 family metallopeptidase C-terminal domain-containing protein [Microvirga sp. KLBC 81]PVE23844.1 hypothetical protein DC522_13815 [Microvirga sp. KLBC 81]
MAAIINTPFDFILNGGRGNDTYVWGCGSGNGTISDLAGVDTLKIDATSAEVQFAKTDDNRDLIVTLGDQRLTIKGYFTLGFIFEGSQVVDVCGAIENIAFSDGKVLHFDDIWNVVYPSPQDGGNNGDEALNGGRGDDKIIAGKGADVLSGGDGHDTFVFQTRDTGLGKNRNVITDFVSGEDLIDLGGIDANTRTAGDQAFTALLSAKKKFTAAGQLRYDAKKGILYGNTDKDAAAEFQIQLKNKPKALDLDDFVL